jgi:hypothetical protein
LSLYRRYGTEARIAAATLRVPRGAIGEDWLGEIRSVLQDMVRLRETVVTPQPVEA